MNNKDAGRKYALCYFPTLNLMYSKKELTEKAAIVLDRFDKEDKVFAFPDGNIFLESKKDAALRHKQETGKDYHLISREAVVAAKAKEDAPEGKESEEAKEEDAEMPQPQTAKKPAAKK